MFWHFSNSPVLNFRQCLHCRKLTCFAGSSWSTGVWRVFFRIDVSMKSSFTHLLIESIAAGVKGLTYVMSIALLSVCSLVLRRLTYFFKQSTIHKCLLWNALRWKSAKCFPGFECLRTWLGKNVTPISVSFCLLWKSIQCSFFGRLPAVQAKSKVFV